MKVILIFILSLIVSCAPESKDGLLIDSFEDDLDSSSVDYGASLGSYVKVSNGNLKVCGRKSLKIDYELISQGYMWVARGSNLDVKGADKWIVKPKDIDFKKYDAFSFYLYGQNNGGVIVFDIKDAKNEMFRFVINDNFSGWKEIICPFSNFFSRKDWQPNNAIVDDKIDFPILSFQFEPRTPGEGTYYVDCVKLIKIKDKK